MEKNLKLFPLQFFAVPEEEESVNEVVEETNDASEENLEEEVTFQDGEEASDDVEAENEETHTEEKQKPKQSKQENEYFKKIRLSQKKQALSNDSTYEQGRIKGILEAVNNTNPFTNEKIEDEEDVQEFLIMREMKDKGLDPVEDYSKYLKKLAREKQAEQIKKNQETEFVQNDLQTFKERHPDKKITELMSDDSFVTFASASLGKVPLADLYDSYNKFMSMSQVKNAKTVEEQVNKAKARSKASSGALGQSSAVKPIDYSNMTDAELEKMIAKAKAGQLSKKFK